MGYADPDQLGTGLRQRIYSRAFIVGDLDKPAERIVYLVLDTQSGDAAIRDGILRGLTHLGPEYSMYQKNNLAVTGTHSHSGPGAWLNYLLPQITSRGFDRQSYQAIVDGALLSIQRAHERLVPGYLSVGDIKLPDGNINRSPYAYLANPTSERAKYDDDVDKTMSLLKFESAESGKTLGVLTWYAVHGTSMYGNNTLISGDNKGVAATLLEKDIRGHPSADPGFVAGFSQSNVGDTSPNVLGAFCESGSAAGDRCSFENSTCAGRSQACHGRGPFFQVDETGTSSCFEIGRRQYQAAKDLYFSMTSKSSEAYVSGGTIRSFHSFTSFANYTFPLANGHVINTCPAALGYSFAAGTTDGPGAFDFTQNNPGDPTANPLWSVVRRFIREPSEQQKACHAPKPILLDVGEIEQPYAWTPNVVDIQVLRIGQLFIIVTPGEATTMAGRRWRDAVRLEATKQLSRDESKDTSKNNPIVLLGGPANTYTHYIATPEEYTVQRYEGASTLYGKHTLDAFIHRTISLLPYLDSNSPGIPEPGPSPPINTNESLSFITPVIVDRAKIFHSFGDVLKSPSEPAFTHGETVKVTFVGANPRNNLRLEGTYVAVERKLNDESWQRVRDDSDWDLWFRWRRTSTLVGTSEVDVHWEIGEDVEKGVYRILYFGDAKKQFGGIEAFEGQSESFEVL